MNFSFAIHEHLECLSITRRLKGEAIGNKRKILIIHNKDLVISIVLATSSREVITSSIFITALEKDYGLSRTAEQ